MLEKQSLSDFIDHINSDKAVIVSVSPQSRASLAAFFGLSQSQVHGLAISILLSESSPWHICSYKYSPRPIYFQNTIARLYLNYEN
jgi:iron only hydrogenase large subunit-like protein